MEPCNLLGKRLKEYRKAAGMKQKEVSERTGISRTSLCRWEHGFSKPSAEQLEVLINLYNERLSKLYPGYVPVTLLPPLVAKTLSTLPPRSWASMKVLTMVGTVYHHTGKPIHTVS